MKSRGCFPGSSRIMKLRVRINRQTSRVELLGEDPSLKELRDHIQEMLLSSHGLSSDTEFGLSLNGSKLLTDTSQTLASCGIVSGDLICVHLPQSEATAAAGSTSSASSTSSTYTAAKSSANQRQSQQTPIMASTQPSSSSSVSGAAGPAVLSESQPSCEMLDSESSASIWEPMLCSEAEEGQAPLSLELLYHTAQPTSPNDAIMVAGHLLMLETGFIAQGTELKPGEMPAGWRCAGGVYKLQYTHPLCESSLASVVAVCMGPMLVMNTTLKVTETVDTVRKLCLNASSYVTNEWPGGSAAAAFKDLSKLSRLFKDQLAYPLIATAREAMALPVAFGLPALPPELLLRVLRLLDVRSVVRLSAVSRHFNVATADSSLWRHLYRRDFADSGSGRSRDTDWKELYKKSYKFRSELRNAAPTRPPPLLPFHPGDIFHPIPYPHFPPVPGIIGGEYDQRPNLPHGLLPRPRYDPIGPLADPHRRPRHDFHRIRPTGGRPSDIRRGFI
ncbi:F-box only protein 7 [Astatotilapia calliptera]|nr:F-box only protein 7 [Astatotilapia calliptera]